MLNLQIGEKTKAAVFWTSTIVNRLNFAQDLILNVICKETALEDAVLIPMPDHAKR